MIYMYSFCSFRAISYRLFFSLAFRRLTGHRIDAYVEMMHQWCSDVGNSGQITITKSTELVLDGIIRAAPATDYTTSTAQIRIIYLQQEYSHMCL